jgi:WD40 repeat protein
VADPAAAASWDEVCRALDHELVALPEVLRGPLVLCYLEGHTRDEAASVLGCSLAMLKRRLERGRKLLRDRLTRRGITFPGAGVGVLAADLSAGTAEAGRTARAAVAYAESGTLSPRAAEFLGVSRVGWVKAAVFVAGLVACGVGLAAFPGLPDDPKNAPGAPMPAERPSRSDGLGDPLPQGAVARLGTMRLRTGAPVERLGFSPDGTQLASWSGDYDVTDALVLWDTKTGRELRRIDLPGARVDHLVWLADGRGIALVRASDDATAPLVWEFTDPKAEKPPVRTRPRDRRGGTAPVVTPPDDECDWCFTVSPDGKSLAVGRGGREPERDREIRLCRLQTGVKADALRRETVITHSGNCGHIHFSPDGKSLVVFTAIQTDEGGQRDGEQVVTVWDAATGKEKSRFKTPRAAANGRVAVAVSDRSLAIGLENGGTSLWDLATGKDRKLATGHGSKKNGDGYGTFAVSFTPDGKTLVTGGRDHLTKLWDLETGKLLRTLGRQSASVETLAVAPRGKILASAGQDGLIRLWDAETGADACPGPGHRSPVEKVALSPDGKLAFTAGWDDTLRWWDAATGAECQVMSVPGGISGLAVSPDGKSVLIATGEGRLRTWDTATNRETTPTNLPRDVKFGRLSFSPDGRHLVSAGLRLTVWEWPALKLARTIDLPKPSNEPGENDCFDAGVSPDGRRLVTLCERRWFWEEGGIRYAYSSDGVVDVWDFATGKQLRRLAVADTQAGAAGTFRTVTFTPDGRVVLVGGGGAIPHPKGLDPEAFKGEMNVLDPVAGRWVREFEVPPVPDTVARRYSGATALSPDGRTLYVSYNTGEIVGFEVATGKPRRTLSGHRGFVGGLAFSADGRRLISGCRDGVALVWDATLSGAASPRREPPTEADALKLWATAGEEDARASFTAMAELARAPDHALAVLRRQVKPAPADPTPAEMDRIFADLDSASFATREKAAEELSEYGEAVAPAVRKRLERAVPPEAKRRALEFLEELDRSIPLPARVRQIRAVELLEGIGTPDAKKFLTELAGAAPPLP